MAKLALTFSFTLICFFFFFAVSQATLPLDPAANDVVEELLPESDSKVSSNILLPSQKPDSDPESIQTQTLVVSEQLQDDPKLTIISFRPINDRQFPRRPFPLTFRHGHGRRCGGHRHHRLRRSDPIVRSYGNDMILSEPVRHQIPSRWTEFHRVEPSFEFGQDQPELPPHHHHHHHHHHGHHHHEHEDQADWEEREHDHGHGGGFLRSFRKFLDRF